MSKLTPEEEVEAQEYIDENSDPNKVHAKKIHTEYKDCRKTKSGLIDVTAFTAKVRLGAITSRQRTVSGYEETIATVEEVDIILSLDRSWTEEIISNVLIGVLCPSTLLSPHVLGVPNGN